MVFWKKDKAKCGNCNSKVISKEFSFCPCCGYALVDLKKESKDYGFLGKFDSETKNAPNNPMGQMPFGLNENILNSLMQGVMKSLDKQIRDMESQEAHDSGDAKASIEHSPNGIKISIGMPKAAQPKQKQQVQRKQITEDQIERLSKLPRHEAKSKMRRIGNKIVYELTASGIESPEDVFISKIESGYEIKAIGKSKVYTNTIPVNLQIRGFSFDNKNLFIEFKAQK